MATRKKNEKLITNSDPPESGTVNNPVNNPPETGNSKEEHKPPAHESEEEHITVKEKKPTKGDKKKPEKFHRIGFFKVMPGKKK